MASECVLMIETELPIMMTVADGVGIEKGAILKLTDPMTCAVADGDADIIAGIAAAEKIANDGVVSLAVYRGGFFKGLAGGAVTVGSQIMTYASTGATNELIDGTNAAVGSKGLGLSMEAADDTHTLLFELRPGAAPNVLA